MSARRRTAMLSAVGIIASILAMSVLFSANSVNSFSSLIAATSLSKSSRDSTATIRTGEGATSNNSILPAAAAVSAMRHNITMTAVKVNESGELYAYMMVSHKVTDLNTHVVTDITSTHSLQPSIPGPTIVIKEGDEVYLTIRNGLKDPSLGIVGVHVHGIHYDILSDGTLKVLNGEADEGAPPPYEVHWIAGPGTKGTWPYHDHTLMGVNGKEYRGLFGAVIINPADGNLQQYKDGNVVNVALSSITKEIVAYARDDSFWVQEIDNTKTEGQNQTPLGTNPNLKAIIGSNVRWHIIPLGTDIHDFKLNTYTWLDPGTTNGITHKKMGPLENHVFVITTKNNPSQYMDGAFKNLFLGDAGKFDGVAAPGPAISTPTNAVLASLTERI